MPPAIPAIVRRFGESRAFHSTLLGHPSGDGLAFQSSLVAIAALLAPIVLLLVHMFGVMARPKGAIPILIMDADTLPIFEKGIFNVNSINEQI